MTSGTRKPPPISTLSPRLTSTSRPRASAASTRRTAAALLLTTIARLGVAQPGQQPAAVVAGGSPADRRPGPARGWWRRGRVRRPAGPAEVGVQQHARGVDDRLEERPGQLRGTRRGRTRARRRRSPPGPRRPGAGGAARPRRRERGHGPSASTEGGRPAPVARRPVPSSGPPGRSSRSRSRDASGAAPALARRCAWLPKPSRPGPPVRCRRGARRRAARGGPDRRAVRVHPGLQRDRLPQRARSRHPDLAHRPLAGRSGRARRSGPGSTSSSSRSGHRRRRWPTGSASSAPASCS